MIFLSKVSFGNLFFRSSSSHGPSKNDVIIFCRFLSPLPLPHLSIFLVLSIGNFDQFLTPSTPLLIADVFYGWPLAEISVQFFPFTWFSSVCTSVCGISCLISKNNMNFICYILKIVMLFKTSSKRSKKFLIFFWMSWPWQLVVFTLYVLQIAGRNFQTI